MQRPRQHREAVQSLDTASARPVQRLDGTGAAGSGNPLKRREPLAWHGSCGRDQHDSAKRVGAGGNDEGTGAEDL